MVNSIVAGYVRSLKYGEFTKTDLVQDATMGLICAVEKFDPTRGFRFATYGQWWVRKYLNEGVQNQNRMIRIPVSLAYRISKVGISGGGGGRRLDGIEVVFDGGGWDGGRGRGGGHS